MSAIPAALAKFVWSDAYALGYPQMDETHHEFVETVNAMLTASDADFARALDVFADHAERHFNQEAEWMNTTSFPATECHIDEHNAVMQSVRQVQEMIKGGHENGLTVGRSLAEELVKWFPGHADYLDSALAQWMAKKAFGGTPVVIRRNIVSSAAVSEPSD